MDAFEAQTTRHYAHNGTVRLLTYTAQNEVEYIGLANFNAPENGDFWQITKFTWETVGSNRCLTRIEDSTVLHKWTDRTNSSVMGWRT